MFSENKDYSTDDSFEPVSHIISGYQKEIKNNDHMFNQ